jgi:hypothetical protein
MNENIKINIDNEVLSAQCPKCGTKYDIGINKGLPMEKGRSPLIPYKTVLSNSRVIVSNW